MQRLIEGKIISLCLWCKKDEKLCRAHLFPDGLKKFLLDDMNGTQKIMRIEMNSKKIQSPVQTLESDSFILCKVCDNVLGKYDNALINFFSSCANLQNSEELIKSKIIKLEVEDEKLVALGFLAILYRFSLSLRHSKINIGEKYKLIFEKWFENGSLEKRDFDYFNIMVIGASGGSRHTNWGLVQYIRRAKIERQNFYTLQMFGFHIIIRVGNKKCSFENSCNLKSLGSENGLITFEMYPPENLFEYDEFRKYFLLK